MRVYKKKKHLILTEKDSGYIISLVDSRFDDYINIKILWTDKGFGLQVFAEDYYNDTKRRRPLNIVVGERGEQMLHKETYAAIWKLTPKFTRKLREKFK